MRILVDTNILISAIFFPGSRVAQTLLYITEHHDMVLCDTNIYELREVIGRKSRRNYRMQKCFWLNCPMN